MNINNSCGAVAVIFNPEDNPGLFKKDNNYVLKRFDLYGRDCVLISEGQKVSLVSDLGMSKEEELLSVYLPDGIENNISSLVLKWYNNNLSLHADVNHAAAKLHIGTENKIGYYNA